MMMQRAFQRLLSTSQQQQTRLQSKVTSLTKFQKNVYNPNNPAVTSSYYTIMNASNSCNYYHTTSYMQDNHQYHGTTILCVRKNGKVCMIGDGQVSMGNIVIKPNARKIRKIYPKTSKHQIPSNNNQNDDKDSSSTTTKTANEGKTGYTIVGFAGATADAFTLLERLEAKLDEHPGQLTRSCVELAKGWRSDKYLRRLEASLLVADENVSLEITGNGDVLESHDKVLAVGSGSPFAMAAARALQDIEELSAEEVARKAMEIASDMCVYTNKNFLVEVMDSKVKDVNSSEK
jgi:ATP-dependent HslUV protease subunit HslV